ncbi:hypothetical protein QBC47DRAFT_154070 [Echria macrotheca]|uniref:NACHT domain-containing protein n=1 Tax=Echria macrotheca TaxID=438768 RepID=A0AAJ0BFH1_9PEZI|nr:hypothetical protein QBC47DRAFT_154070 [Echria macrotheca]
MTDVIGAISASLHLTKEVVKYCRCFKSAPSDAANLATEVAAIGRVLEDLQQSLRSSTSRVSFQQTSSLLSCIQDCHRRMQELEASLAPHVSKLGRLLGRAKWPLNQRETVEKVEALHRFMRVFHFATTLDGLTALSLPLGESIQKLDSLQQSYDAGQRQSQAAVKDIVDALRLLPQVDSQIRSLTVKIDNFAAGVDSQNRAQAIKDETTSAYRDLCQMLQKIPICEYQDRHRTLQLTRMNGGSRWIFKTPNYEEWLNGLSVNTLWCNGGPGVGKTYLASVVTDELILRSQRSRDSELVLFFYFDYSKQLDQTALRVLQTLLHQLLSTHSEVPPLAAKLAKDLMAGKPLPSFEEMRELFIKLCGNGQPVFIVLDALDECDALANRKPVLELIKSIKASPARLLVTSRPYPPDVEEVLGDCPQVLVEASDKDIEKYVLEHLEGSVEMRRMLHGMDDLKKRIVDAILHKSQGMFLLPALQVNNILGQTNIDEVEQAINTMPNGLADNLAMTIERIKRQHSQNEARSRLAFLVLRWLATVRRPITTKELQHALAARPGLPQLAALTDPKLFVESCFGLTIIDKETSVIRLVHFSVKEFLQEKRAELFDDPESAAAASCLSYMAVCIRTEPSFVHGLTQGSSLARRTHQWPFWEYAAWNWGLHAANADKSCVGLAEEPLRDFVFSPGLLFPWLSYGALSHPFYQSSEFQTSLLTETSGPLHVAVVYGISSLVKECLFRGFTGNERDGNAATPFMLAAANNRQDTLKVLLEAGFRDINSVDNHGHSALFYAMRSRRTEAFRFLLRRPSIDVNTGNVLDAVEETRHDIPQPVISMLLSHPGFDLQPQSHRSVIYTLFHLARECKAGYLELTEGLLRRPDFHIRQADYEVRQFWETLRDISRCRFFIDRPHNQYASAEMPAKILLIEKTFPGHICSLEALNLIWRFVYFALAGTYQPPGPTLGRLGVYTPADRDVLMDWPQEEALASLTTEGYIASSYWRGMGVNGAPWGMNILCEMDDSWHAFRAKIQSYGISLSTTDSQGRGFIHAICGVRPYWYGYDPAAPLVFLLRMGVDINLRDKAGQTPLHYLVSWGDAELVKTVISWGADPRAIDNEGWTTLHFACKGKRKDVVRLLVDEGADVCATTADGQSVLHVVTQQPWDAEVGAVTRYLVEKGCLLNARDKWGENPGISSTYVSAEALSTYLDLGLDPFEPQGPTNISMLMLCVIWKMRTTSLCLAHLRPSQVAAELNRLGPFGTSVLDHLSQFDRATAADLGFTEEHWRVHKPTPLVTRRKHLVAALIDRIGVMLTLQDKDKHEFAEGAAYSLLQLGADEGARIILEQFLAPESRNMRVPFVRGIFCCCCGGKDAPIFICRVCPLMSLCAACRDAASKGGDYEAVEYCQPAHGFLEFPGDHWRDLPDGKVNLEGQTYDEFLVQLKEWCARELESLGDS